MIKKSYVYQDTFNRLSAIHLCYGHVSNRIGYKTISAGRKKIVLIKWDLEKGFTASVSKYHPCHYPRRYKNKAVCGGESY